MTATLDPAPRDAAASQIARLEPHLAPLTRQRLDKLLALVGPDHRIVYADAYTALFPDSASDPAAKTRADKSFGKLRNTLAAIAAEHGVTLGLKVDQRRNANPADRRLWFVAEDDSEARIGRSADSATQGLPETHADQYVAVFAETVEPFYVLVYAQTERDDAKKLHDAIGAHLKASDCTWSMKDWHNPGVGVHVDTTRRAWMKDARFVLVLASPQLIADIKVGSIALETGRPLVVLALRAVSDDQVRGTPLAGLPIFDGQGADPWTACRGSRRDEWMENAAATVLELARRPQTSRDPFARLARPDWDRFGDMPDDHYVHQHTATPGQPQGRVALDLLLEWLADPGASVLCAIFGELGMGKTTLCQRLTRDLLRRRAAGEALPLPVYLDLRAVNTLQWGWGQGVPPLGTMLDHIVAKAYNLGVNEPRPSAEQIARLAQQNSGLIIFDGLDEVMNRLTPEQNRLFIEQLWSVLPPILWKPPAQLDKKDRENWRRPAAVGRLLMTCRSHFFQNLQDQVSTLVGQQRDPIGRADYLWATLLPFTPRQVETYFHQVFADDPERAVRVIAMLDAVHDLKELGSRPYNLRLIQDQVDALEAVRREGRRVDIADLYEGLVGQWTRRDDPKHRLNRDHKLLLMERLALRLWSAQQANLPYADLNDWLVDQILADPRWERVEYRAYLDRTGGADILKEDLRNASFLVREGDDRFRFAHTSIQEFFLARALHRALVEDRLDQWAIPIPSPETLEFLGGLIAARNTDACEAGLARIRARYQPKASELVLAYALHAQERDFPGADCTGFQLPGAELRFQRWKGRDNKPLCWRGANLSGARLDGGVFIACDFTGTNFDHTHLTGALLDGCRLERISACEVDLVGAAIHACPAEGTDFSTARTNHTQWLTPLAGGPQGEPPAVFLIRSTPPPPTARPMSTKGHVFSVTQVQRDPKGGWLATAGESGVIRVWHPATGRLLHRMEGHQGPVRALVVFGDEASLASAGDDCSVRLWDPKSGQLVRRLEGVTASIVALAIDPGGGWLACAGRDGSVCLLHPASEFRFVRIGDHLRGVSALAAAPDGSWLASAGGDGKLQIWDPQSGGEIRRLRGHGGWIWALAISPDGAWLASAGDDRTVRIWDTTSGAQLHLLDGHRRAVVALAVSPDGLWLASAARDGNVRVWSVATGSTLHQLESGEGDSQALAVAPDGSWLACTGTTGDVRLWDPKSGHTLRWLEDQDEAVNAFAVAPDGTWLATAEDNGNVRLWDPATARPLHLLEGQDASVSALAVSPEGVWLAAARSSGTFGLWDPVSGSPLRQLGGHTDWIYAVAVSRDGTWVASSEEDGGIQLWDAASGQPLRRLDTDDPILVATPNGMLGSAGRDGKVRLWDPKSGHILRVIDGHEGSVTAIAVAPDGAWLVTGGYDGAVRLWELSSGNLLRELIGHQRWVSALAVSPDGTWLACAGPDGSVQTWDPASGSRLRRLDANTTVRTLAISPNGTWLASGGDDGTVRLWNPKTGRSMHRLSGHEGGVSALAVSPDGTWLASAGYDGAVRLWSLPPKVQTPVCELAVEMLPEDNWVTWRDPDGPNRRWVHWSRDAWRWLGWHAPLPDGTNWMFYPMDAFRPEPPGVRSSVRAGGPNPGPPLIGPVPSVRTADPTGAEAGRTEGGAQNVNGAVSPLTRQPSQFRR